MPKADLLRRIDLAELSSGSGAFGGSITLVVGDAGAGGLMYNYIIHEGGGICTVVNGLTGATEARSSDYRAIIQHALNSAGPDSSIAFRPGRYTVNGPLTPNQRQTIWLAAGVIFIPAGDNAVWSILSRDRVAFHGTLTIEDEAARTTTQPAIVIDDMAFAYFERIVIWNTYHGINISGTAGGTHENYYTDIWMQVRGRGINLETACHDNHFGHVWIKGPAPDNWATGPGLRIGTSGTQGGNSFLAIEILDMYWGMDLPGAYEVWFGNVIIDNPRGTGIWMSGQVERLFFNTVWASSGGDGVHLEGNPSVLPITYVDKVHFVRLYTWLNANWGLRFSGYIKGVVIDELVAQRCAKGVGFEGVENNNIIIGNLYTLENGEWGLNGANAGTGVTIGNAMIEDALLNPDTFAALGGFTSGGRFHSKGTATILAGATQVVVTHGLDQTPEIITLTPYAAAGPHIAARTATTFTIAVPVAPDADLQVAWSAWSRANAR